MTHTHLPGELVAKLEYVNAQIESGERTREDVASLTRRRVELEREARRFDPQYEAAA